MISIIDVGILWLGFVRQVEARLYFLSSHEYGLFSEGSFPCNWTYNSWRQVSDNKKVCFIIIRRSMLRVTGAPVISWALREDILEPFFPVTNFTSISRIFRTQNLPRDHHLSIIVTCMLFLLVSPAYFSASILFILYFQTYSFPFLKKKRPKVAQNSSNSSARLRFWWIIKASLYQLTLQSGQNKIENAIIFVTQ